MKRKVAAIVQRREGWYGVTFAVREKEISDLRLYTDKSLPELERIITKNEYGIALENSAAYLFNLAFPFTSSRKIRLVIGNEMEERVPFSMDDMAVDFVENGRGKVLAAAVHRSLLEEFRKDKDARIATVQGLAVLHVLRWRNLIREKDFVFMHVSGSAVIIMGFKDNELHYLRQFLHSPQSDSLGEAFSQIADDKDFTPRSYVMVSDDINAEAQKVEIENSFRIHIERPLLSNTFKKEDMPEWLWPGIGAALLSVRPKGEVNLIGGRRLHFFPSSKTGLYVSAGLAALAILVLGLSYLDYSFKERTYQYLAAEPNRIYRTTFPKSPPIKDPARMLREKIKALDVESGSLSAANPLALLDGMSRNIPPEIDVKVSEFTSDNKEFTLSGTTVSFASIEKVKAGVEKIKGVSDVEMQNLEVGANRQVKFKMRGRI